jgi:hypothetical protein
MVMHVEITIQDHGCLFHGVGLGQPQLTDQSILKVFHSLSILPLA